MVENDPLAATELGLSGRRYININERERLLEGDSGEQRSPPLGCGAGFLQKSRYIQHGTKLISCYMTYM